MTRPTNALRPILQARIEESRLIGHGYALAEFEQLDGCLLQFTFQLGSAQPLSFVFGFQGVGQHYRCDLDPASNLVILHWFRDGVPVYLNHTRIRLEVGEHVSIRWTREAIRVYLADNCFINVMAGGIPGGRWGFATGSRPLLLPPVEMMRLPSPCYRWVVLGDGYSNNRWKSRNFFSWPELAFGHLGDYLNACVAAGNTRRVLQVAESISRHLKGGAVIIAAGVDDFIEGERLEGTITRLTQVIDIVRNAGANSVHLCSMPPRAKHNAEIRRRNQAMSLLASTVTDGFIDLHSALEAHSLTLMVNGDYPGPDAQRIMAATILAHFALPQELASLHHVESPAISPLLVPRVLTRLAHKIESILGHISATGIS